MPTEVIILLAIAGAGLLGSITLMVCNNLLGKRIAVANDDGYDFDDMDDSSDIADTQAEDEAREIKFTPLGEEETVTVAQMAMQEDEPVTTAPVRLMSNDAHMAGQEGTTVVGNIRLSIGNAQDIGMRPQQQDAFAITPLEESLVVENHGVMAVVCDGMGGMENGAEAANLGAIEFMRAYLAADQVKETTLVDSVYQSNRAVYSAFQGKTGTIAGTTLVAASILTDGLRFVSVGDSHIYLYRNSKLYQLNRDHNYFSELLEEVKAGRITMEEAQRHPERAHLTSFVGIETLELVDYNVEPVELRAGDRLLLCSDGLFKTLALSEISSILATARENEAQDDLLAAVRAKNKRKQDNVTIVMLYCDAAR